MKDPIDSFLEEKRKLSADRDAEDMHAFHTWKAKPNKKTLGVLLDRFEPVFNAKVRDWKAEAVPRASFKADLQKNAIGAFHDFDPNRGARLRTHVTNRLRRSHRFNAKYQNMAYIPEEKAALIAPVQQAKDYLHQEFGTPPTHQAIAGYLTQNPDMLPKRKGVPIKVTPKLVKTVFDYQIKDIPGGAFESDPSPKPMSYSQETIDLLRPALKGDEQIVYDYLFGKNGKPKVTSGNEIARRMGKNPTQISRLKRRVEATYRKYA